MSRKHIRHSIFVQFTYCSRINMQIVKLRTIWKITFKTKTEICFCFCFFLIKMVSYPTIVWIINKRRTRITKNFINAPAFNRINTISNRYHCNSWTLWLRISFKLQFCTNFVDTPQDKFHLPLSSSQRWMPPEFKLQWHRNLIRVVRPSVWNITTFQLSCGYCSTLRGYSSQNSCRWKISPCYRRPWDLVRGGRSLLDNLGLLESSM